MLAEPPPPKSRDVPLLTVPFLVVGLATFGYFVAIGITIPVLPRFVEGELGGGGLAVGVSVGSFAVSAALLRPWVGRLGDHMGRRLLVVGGCFIVAGVTATYSLATNVPVLVGLRLITGIGEAALFVGAATAAQDLAPDDRRGEAASYFSVALYGGLAIGPIIGESIYRSSGADPAWMAAAVIAAVAGLVALRMPGHVRHPDGPPRRVGGFWAQMLHPAAVLPGTVLMAGMFGVAAFVAFMPLHVDELDLGESGTVFAVYAVAVLGVRVFGARIPDRFGPVSTATASLVSIAAGMTVLAVWATSAGLYTGALLFALGMSLLFPALFVLVMNHADDSERTHAVGSFSMFFDLSQALGGVVLGAAVALGDERTAFVVAAIAAGLGLAMLRTVVATRQAAPQPS